MTRLKKPLREVALDFPDWEVSHTGGGHLRWTHATGAVVFSSSSPSDFRATSQLRRDLRRREQAVTS